MGSGSASDYDGLTPTAYFDKVYPPLAANAFLEVWRERVDLATGSQGEIRQRLYDAMQLRLVQDYSAPNATFAVYDPHAVA